MKLQELRRITGYSQEEFAKAIGIGRTQLVQLEASGEKPGDELKDKIQEIVLVRLLTPIRRMLSRERRKNETETTIGQLEEYENKYGTNALSKLRVLIFVIDDPRIPGGMVVNGDWALRFFYGTKVTEFDVILLIDYEIDNILGTESNLPEAED